MCFGEGPLGEFPRSLKPTIIPTPLLGPPLSVYKSRAIGRKIGAKDSCLTPVLQKEVTGSEDPARCPFFFSLR